MGKHRRGLRIPETEVGATIRKYAANYMASGQKDRAEGMAQAADVADKMLKGGSTFVTGVLSQGLEARVARLEAAVFKTRVLPPEMDHAPRGQKTPREVATTLLDAPSPVPAPEPVVRRPRPVSPPRETALQKDGSALVLGEERILAAVAQRRSLGRTLDELTALVDLRETSLRTYLSNLRAGGYVESHGNKHIATDAGAARVAGHEKFPIGPALLKRWLDPSTPLTAGEVKILKAVAAGGATTAILSLIGDATGLKETSVRTYVTTLARRRLVMRAGKGLLSIAPILTEGAR